MQICLTPWGSQNKVRILRAYLKKSTVHEKLPSSWHFSCAIVEKSKLESTSIRACFLFTFYSHPVCNTPFTYTSFILWWTLRIIWEPKLKRAAKQYVIQSDPARFIWIHSNNIYYCILYCIVYKNSQEVNQ